MLAFSLGKEIVVCVPFLAISRVAFVIGGPGVRVVFGWVVFGEAVGEVAGLLPVFGQSVWQIYQSSCTLQLILQEPSPHLPVPQPFRYPEDIPQSFEQVVWDSPESQTPFALHEDV